MLAIWGQLVWISVFFTQGNLLAVLTSLADREQSAKILSLIEQCWTNLVGQMPLKICFPALEGRDWQRETGCDRKKYTLVLS